MAQAVTRETLIQELEGLAEEQMPEVLDFIRFLKAGGPEERVIFMDTVDYRILRATAAYRTLPPHPSPLIDHSLEPAGLDETETEQAASGADDILQARWNRVIAAYLDGHVNLGRAADLLGLSVHDLRDRFLRLGVPLRLGPETLEDAEAEVAISLSLNAR